MATKFQPNIITAENKWKYSGAAFRPLFAGNLSLAPEYVERIITSLDDFDKNYTSKISLKPGEQIFRCSTDRSRMCKIEYLVKINVEKGLIYFLEPNENDAILEFSKKGNKLAFLNILSDFSN